MKQQRTIEELQRIVDRQLARIRRGEPMDTVKMLSIIRERTLEVFACENLGCSDGIDNRTVAKKRSPRRGY